MSLEKLHGVNITEKNLIIKVTNKGCTKKSDFSVQKNSDDPNAISFIRDTPDPCKMAPRILELAFDLEELDFDFAQGISVRNPFINGPTIVG